MIHGGVVLSRLTVESVLLELKIQRLESFEAPDGKMRAGICRHGPSWSLFAAAFGMIFRALRIDILEKYVYRAHGRLSEDAAPYHSGTGALEKLKK